MDTVKVTNLTHFTQHVGVVHEDGTRDAVQIMAKRSVDLREGMVVCKRWLGLNSSMVKVTTPNPHMKIKNKGESK